MNRLVLVILLLTLVLMNCNSIGDKKEKYLSVQLRDSLNKSIQMIEYEYGDTINVNNSFACQDTEQFSEVNYATITLLNKDSLKIVNGFESGYGGYKIRITVDENLKVQTLEYEDWSDDIRYISINSILEVSSFELNKNPFSEGLEGLSGKYRFLRKNDGYADSSLYLAGTNAHTFYYDEVGEFSCN